MEAAAMGGESWQPARSRYKPRLLAETAAYTAVPTACPGLAAMSMALVGAYGDFLGRDIVVQG